jgi:hypothetical protein
MNDFLVPGTGAIVQDLLAPPGSWGCAAPSAAGGRSTHGRLRQLPDGKKWRCYRMAGIRGSKAKAYLRAIARH